MSKQTKQTGTTQVTIQVPRSVMHDIMRTAIEAGHTYGIGYWACEDGNSVELIERETLYPVALRFTFKDAYAIDKAGGKQSTIDERDIARAIGKALTVSDLGEYADAGAAEAAAQWLAGNGDGPSADVLVQLAVFNEVVYG